MKDKFKESECFHYIGKVKKNFPPEVSSAVQSFIHTESITCGATPAQVQLSLGDFVAARRSLKKALQLGSQQPLEKQAVKKAFRYGKIRFTFLCLTLTEMQFVCLFLHYIYFFIIQLIRAVNWRTS